MLRSPTPATRATALSWLSGKVTHQGTRWPVSAAVVPFLVALIDDQDTPDRESLLPVLHAVVLGDATLPFDPDFAAGDALTADDLAEATRLLFDVENLAAELDSMDRLNAAAVRWGADAYRAGAAQVPTFTGWLADPALAAEAAELLAYFPPSSEVVEALVSSVTPASANLTLAYLPASPKVDTHLTGLLHDAPLDVRMTAAVALAFRMGPDLPGPALDLLVDVSPPPAPPGWDRSMRGFVTLALRRVGL